MRPTLTVREQVRVRRREPSVELALEAILRFFSKLSLGGLMASVVKRVLQLNDEYRIVHRDSMNLSLERYREVEKRNGQTEFQWVVVGYYGYWQQAFRRWAEQLLIDNEISGIRQIQSLVTKFKKDAEALERTAAVEKVLKKKTATVEEALDAFKFLKEEIDG